MTPADPSSRPLKPGLASREAAMRLFHRVLTMRRTLDEESDSLAASDLAPDDRALARAIATTSFRQLGSIRAALDARVENGWPHDAGLLQPILVTAVAQILFMNTPDHAAVDLALTLIHADRRAGRYAKLANAVLRGIGRDKDALLAAREASPRSDMPAWLVERWEKTYGAEATDSMARALRARPQIDLTLNVQKPDFNRATIAHLPLPGGSLRLKTDTRIEDIPGFAEGAWWVQDAAAAVPVRLVNAAPGQRILDMCAAPGGKTAQLASTGADVTALDRSGARLKRLRSNLDRLGLTASIVEGDGTTYQAAPFDAILIDAPCSATGTIRRHPELAWTRTLEDLAKLIPLQQRLLQAAARLLKPGGTLVYATCSLEQEEGERQIAQFLLQHPSFKRVPITAAETGMPPQSITVEGDWRLLPHYLKLQGDDLSEPMDGTDGFFAARLRLV
jgi:16S rRNA (cytosine967-C5)-methyltransferase